MAEIIEMPKLSDTMEEGGVANWLVKEGDFIEEGAAIVEIETDKATMEYNSPFEGTLLQILVKKGETCELNAPIAVIGEKGEAFDLTSLTGPKEGDKRDEKAKKAPPPPKKSASPKPSSSAPVADLGRVKASPLAKKMAREAGLDLTQIKGTGPSGRVVMKDIEGYQPNEQASSQPTGGVQSLEDYTDIPLSMMRKTIAKRLLSGKNEAPHFYLNTSVNMTKLISWRKSLNQNLDDHTPKVSINDLIVLAAAKALLKHPEVNASWQGDVIRQYKKVHMAVAVALPQGLVTPVIRDVAPMGARGISKETRRLVQAARDGALQSEDYAGGTFTISNLGMMGIESFTAIINPPQAAILAVGKTADTPVVLENGTLGVEPRMKLTMSCDHRVVDGAVGAMFLQTLVQFLEDPMMMLS